MDKYIDEVFGEVYDDSGIRKNYELDIFNKKFKPTLSLDRFSFDKVTDFQRQAFIEFEKNKQNIIEQIEQATIQYCKENYQVLNDDEIFNNVQLVSIIIHRKCEDNKRIIGFLINDNYDIELGIGVQVINEQVHDIDNQYLIV